MLEYGHLYTLKVLVIIFFGGHVKYISYDISHKQVLEMM